jgi:hypothetical protein
MGGLLVLAAAILGALGCGGAHSGPAAADNVAASPQPAAAATADSSELAALQAENEQLRQANQHLSTAAAEVKAAGEKQGLAHRSEPTAAPAKAPETDKWIILFRADDPSAWDTPSYTAERWAVPLHLVPDFRYLRLRRMDTGEALILQMSRDQLRNDKLPAPETGYWWNGSAKVEWMGRHLGIAQGPRYKFPVPKGMICVMNQGWDSFTGSGFGHKAFVDNAQYYCWRGQEIPKTVFEIAVTAGPLSPEEESWVVGGP